MSSNFAALLCRRPLQYGFRRKSFLRTADVQPARWSYIHLEPSRNGIGINRESLFEAQALSGAGARGLMQIMPETGKKLYGASGPHAKPFDEELLFEPGLNIALGIKYLSQLNQRFGNNGTHILISYNAGPHVLKKWLKRFRNIDDPDVFIESIPYPETRRYVKHVLRNHGVYKLLYQ